MLLILLILLIIIYSIGLVYSKRSAKKKILKLSKNNYYRWMNLTKKERYDQSKIDSDLYLNKRKDLLNEIREKYKDISKNK